MSVIDDQKIYEMDVEEDGHGTYFFNSYDMNLIGHVKELIDSGVTSLKIEGRAKSVYYVAVVARAYRKVIDAVETQNFASVRRKKIESSVEASIEASIKEQKKELDNLAHRGYSTGFLLGTEPAHNFENRNNEALYKFVGEIVGNWGKKGDKGNVVRVHNEIFLGDRVEAVTPDENIPIKIKKIYDDKMNEISEAHGGHEREYYFEFSEILEKKSLVRKKCNL
jgi:putative protease